MKITDNRFLLTFALLLVSWAFVYQDALLGMEDIWSRSDTFAHGYFMLPISIWLIWRDKGYLLSSYTQTTWLPLPILFGSLLVWLFAFAVDINVLGQLSAVLSLISLIWIIIGNKLAWRYKFPLAYLLFAVPMGENLIPMLQDITAWFTVNLLKLNGIPVFSDGLYIQIPTGMFEVAVACSGIRYLIASVAVGTLFAYLTYTSTKKQIIFILFAIFMPIVANGVRAYGIVAIAYYSDMKYATGVDHLIYGWLFFGVVIMLMFWIGGKFADQEKIVKPNNELFEQKGKQFIVYPVLSLFMLVAVFGVVKNIDVIQKPEIATASLSNTNDFKTVVNSDWGITYESGLHRSHLINESGFEIFNAVYAHKQNQGEFIGWDNIIFANKGWTIVKTKELTINDSPATYLLLRTTSGVERNVLYWFNVAEHKLTNRNVAKLRQAIEIYRNPSSQAEIIAFSMKNIQEPEFIALVKAWQFKIDEMKLVP